MLTTVSIEDAKRQSSGAVFVDNLTFASVQRLLYDRYESVSELLLASHVSVSSALVIHDIANLANLVDTLLSSDTIYTNADYTDIWYTSTRPQLGRKLQSIVVGVEVPAATKLAIETEIAGSTLKDDIEAPGFAAIVEALGDLGSCYHHGADQTPAGVSKARMRSELFLPYRYSDVVFSPQVDIVLGVGFYLACSRATQTPFRPSIVRASLLRRRLSREIQRWRLASSEFPLSVLEQSEAAAMASLLERIQSAGVVDRYTPAALAYVLRHADAPEDIVELTLQLRNSDEGHEYRRWAGEFAVALQAGSLKSVARYQRELSKVVDSLNRRFKVAAPQQVIDISVGWSPVQMGRAVHLPAILSTPLNIKRHMWLLYHFYKLMLTSDYWHRDANRVLIDQLSPWMRSRLGDLDWRHVAARKVPRWEEIRSDR